jgi:uncharacterized protein YbaP (TraB family)
MKRRRFEPFLQTNIGPITGARVCAPRCVKAVTAKKTWLWKIAPKKKGQKTSYLFGTCHLADARILNVPRVVERAFVSSDVFMGELKLGATDVSSILKRFVDPTRTLKDDIPKALYAKVRRALKAFRLDAGVQLCGPGGLGLGRFEQFKVWGIAVLLVTMMNAISAASNGDDNGGDGDVVILDKALYDRAKTLKKKLGGLETPEDQLSIFDDMTASDQLEFLRSVFTDDKKSPKAVSIGGSVVRCAINAYLKGNHAATARMANAFVGDTNAVVEGLGDLFMGKRNEKMGKKIARLLGRSRESHFFAVGVGHLVGENNLVDHLVRDGFKVTNVKQREGR